MRKTGIILLCLTTSVFAMATSSSRFNIGVLALKDANDFFKQIWQKTGQNTGDRAAHQFPVILMDQRNSNLELLTPQGSKSFNAIVSPFNELKAVAHMAPCLSAIGLDAWDNGVDWHKPMQALKEKWDRVVLTMDTVDWSNPAFHTEEMVPFVQNSIKKIQQFIDERLIADRYTKEDFAHFSDEFHKDVVTLVFLGTVVHAYKIYFELKKWKEEVGEKAWDKLMVVIYGDIIPTIGLTPQTNPFAMAISALMDPQHSRNYILIAPSITTKQEALGILGNVLNRVATSQALFPTHEEQEHSLKISALLKDAQTLISLESLRELLEVFKEKGEQPIHPFLFLQKEGM